MSSRQRLLTMSRLSSRISNCSSAYPTRRWRLPLFPCLPPMSSRKDVPGGAHLCLSLILAKPRPSKNLPGFYPPSVSTLPKICAAFLHNEPCATQHNCYGNHNNTPPEDCFDRSKNLTAGVSPVITPGTITGSCFSFLVPRSAKIANLVPK